MLSILKKCSCLKREPEDVKLLDFKHCGLSDVPNDIFIYERTLEELYLDFNQIQDLPRPLFYCHELRKLGLSDNEIQSLPSAIASLINLEKLDICKNAILDIPDNIKLCKCLRILEASVNPLGKLPEGFTQLINLEELYLNDTFVDYLPANFGRLSKLKILELRENHLKCLPKSMARLSELSRLDIGQNDFRELPEVIGNLRKLSELWCDCNRISVIPPVIGNLNFLTYLDASKNRIESIPSNIESCVNLTDVTLSSNNLKSLPETIGLLKNLAILRLDDNRLQKLPSSIGSMSNLEELVISQNSIQHIPAGIGLLRKLHTLLVDENNLEELPSEVGSCVNLTILSVRCNRLVAVPDEIGHNSRLRIVNFSENRIRFLPYGLKKLKDLQALWLSENQNKPLIPLQGDIDIDTGQRVLTCYLLPQISGSQIDDYASDSDSFQLSVWEEQRPQRQHIKFAYDEKLDKPGKLIRNPTPYPKELKSHVKHARNQALKSKGGANYVNINALTAEGELLNENPEPVIAEAKVSQLSESINVKEAKVTKPSSPNISLDPHDSWPLHENVKLGKSKTVRDNLPHSHDKANEIGSLVSENKPPGNTTTKEISIKSETHLKENDGLGSGSSNRSEDGNMSRSEHNPQTRYYPASDMNVHSGYRSDHEVYENLRKDSLVSTGPNERQRKYNKAVSDGYASDLEFSKRPYNDHFMTPGYSYNRMGKAASVSTAVAKKLFNDNSFNRPSVLNSHNIYFVHENKPPGNSQRREMDFNKHESAQRLSHGPPPDLLPRNTGQVVFDTNNSLMYAPGQQFAMYPMPSTPHNPVPLPPRRRPSNLNLFPVSAPSEMPNFSYSPQIPTVVSGYHLRPSPPSPNRNRKPPPYHIATTYSKHKFIGPPSPVLKQASSVTYRPSSPSLVHSLLTPSFQSNTVKSSTPFRRSCHGSDPALARSNTPPSPSHISNGSFRQRSLSSSVNGAIVFDNPYVEGPADTKRSRHHDSVPSFSTKGNWSPQMQKRPPNYSPNGGRRGSLSAPSTPPLPLSFTDSSPTTLLPSYRTPPLYPCGSVNSLNGSFSGESSKCVSHKRNAANGYHISGPRWPSTSTQDIPLELAARDQSQCGIFTALPVLVKSCSGADMRTEPPEHNTKESVASTVYANMYTSTG